MSYIGRSVADYGYSNTSYSVQCLNHSYYLQLLFGVCILWAPISENSLVYLWYVHPPCALHLLHLLYPGYPDSSFPIPAFTAYYQYSWLLPCSHYSSPALTPALSSALTPAHLSGTIPQNGILGFFLPVGGPALPVP